jgi:tetratricopeptide (TPR) repeat protein
MQAFYVCAYFVWKPMAPFDLSATYPTLHAFEPFAVPFVCSAIFILVAVVTAIVLRCRWPAGVVLLVCHIIVLLPVLGLSEYPHSASDRYSYLHGALWVVALAFVLNWFWQQERPRQIVGWAAALVCVFLGFLTWRQAPVWRNTITLYENMVQRFGNHPSRARFDEVLGVYYLKAGRTNDAIKSLEAATRFETLRQDRHLYEERVLSRSHVRLGEVFMAQSDSEHALEHYHAAAKAEPSSRMLLKLGNSLAQMNRHVEAVPPLSEALRLDPENPSIHRELGLVLQKLGQSAQAERHFTDARRLLAEK